jgi:EAL domain-containing protein (putative c-di-GMP-specific phosphodiesterase class I)
VRKIDAGVDSLLTLLRTMLTMLADLGFEITAEGVESPLEREWLLRQGARKGQGTLFAAPVPISEAIAALRPLA